MRRELKVLLTLAVALMMVCILGCGDGMTANAESDTPSDIVAVITPPTQETEEQVQGNNIQWWQGEWKTEYIINSAGNEVKLRYLDSIIWPESEEECLARFLSCEGGNYEEKTRIAQLVVWRKYDSHFGDTIQDVLKTNSYFAIYPEFWNEKAVITEEDYEIAKEALNSTEKPEYVHYIFKEFYEDFGPKEDVYMTENFVFFN